MVRPEGLEPPTGGLEIRCSIQLSYGRTAGHSRRARVYYRRHSPAHGQAVDRSNAPRCGMVLTGLRGFAFLSWPGNLFQSAAGCLLGSPAEVAKRNHPDEALIAVEYR